MLLEAKPEKAGRPVSPFHRLRRVCEVLVNWISGSEGGEILQCLLISMR